MADKQKLIELDINTDSIISKSVELKGKLDQMRKDLADLKKSGDTSSETYVKLEAATKKLSSEYAANQKQLVNLNNANSDLLSVQEKVNLLINEEITSIDRAKLANKEMIAARDKLNLSTEEGRKAQEALNKKIDENDEFIKENVSSLEKQKIGIGNYREEIVAAIGETGLFSGELSSLNSVAEKFNGVFDLMKSQLDVATNQMRNSANETEGMSVAQRGLTVATNLGTGAMRIFALAIAATGIGLIIIAVALLISYFKTFTPVVDFVEQAMAGLGAVIKVVQKGVVAFVTGLSDLGNTLKKVGSFLSNPIKGFKDMASSMEEAYDAAAKLKKEQQDLEDAIAAQELASAKNRAEINRLNIQAKDRTKLEQERLAMLQKASEIEEKDYQQRKANADEALRIAQQQIINEAELTKAEAEELKKRGFDYKEFVEQRTNGVDDLFDALKDALLLQTDLENEFYTNQEKNINKQNKLIEDAEAAREKASKAAEDARKKREEERQKRIDDMIAKQSQEIELYIAQQGERAKSIQEQFKIDLDVFNKRMALNETEFKNKKKTFTEYETERLTLQNEFAKKQAELTVAIAQRELDAYTKNNLTKVEQDKFFSDLAYQQEVRRLDLIAQANKDFQALRLEQGVIDEQAYQDAITAIQDETRIKKEEAQKERDVAESERKAIDLENQLLIEEQLFNNSLSTQLQRLELRRQQEIKESDKTGASIKLINEKYANAEKILRQSVEQSKLQLTADGLSQAKGLFKENTTAYKAFAVAEATINTYKAASLALSTYAYPLGGIFAGLAIAQGLMNVGKIVGVKLAKGGRVKGPGTGTSDSIPAQLSDGETVINAKSSDMYAPLLSAINVAGGGTAFANGGLQYPATVLNTFNTANQTTTAPSIDYDLLAEKIANANRQLPPGKIVIEEFEGARKDWDDNRNGANF